VSSYERWLYLRVNRQKLSGKLQLEIESYLRERTSQGLLSQTTLTYRQVLECFASWMNDNYSNVRSATEVKALHLKAFNRYLEDLNCYKHNTIVKYLSVIRVCIRSFGECSHYDIPKYKRRTGVRLSESEITELIDQTNTDTEPGLRDRALIAVLACKKFRVHEICNLSRSQIATMLWESRNSIIDDRARLHIGEYLMCRKDNFGALFIRYKPGKMLDDDRNDNFRGITRQTVNRILAKYAKMTDLQYIPSANSFRIV